MAKPELGIKRLCPNCGAKYYDLNRSPILCPRCGASFDPYILSKARPSMAVDEEEDLEEEEVELAPEFVSLEDVEDADGDDVPEIEDTVIDDGGDDDTFLEEEDEDEGDVSDIIGEREPKEER